MKQTVHENVVWVTSYESTWPSSNLLEFADWIAQKISIIPAEYRPNAEIEIEMEDPYEAGSTLEINIFYRRLETDEEEAKRENHAKRCEEEKVVVELNTLAYLKAKYEQPQPDNI